MESHRVITALIAFMLLFSLAAGQPSRIRAEVGMEADVMSRQHVTTLPDGPGSDSLLIAEMDSLLNTINLDEVVVVAPIKPVTVKGDTTIIDTRAFKTRDGAYLEDLVRLIPGMAYDKKTGTLTYNGIPLTDININGESFFKDGKTLALENLRADIFSKIKIYDKASDEDKFMGIKGNGKNYVLDLQTYSEFNGTLMASATLAGGNQGRKKAELMAHSFKPKGDNFSFHLSSGNINPFSTGKRDRADDASFNISRRLNDKFYVSAGLMYSYSRAGQEFSSSREDYLPAGNTYSYSQADNRNSNRHLRSHLTLNWNVDDNTMLTLSGMLGNTASKSQNDSRSMTFDADPGLNVKEPFADDALERIDPSTRINENEAVSLSKDRAKNYSVEASVTRRLNDTGTALSLNLEMTDNTRKGRAFNVSTTNYYRLKDDAGLDSILHRDQYNLTPTVNRSRGVGLRFVQPLMKHLKLELAYRYRQTREKYSRNTFDLSPFFDRDEDRRPGQLPEGYESAYIDSLSNHSFSRVEKHEAEVRLMYMKQNYTMILSFVAEPEKRRLDQKTGVMQADTLRSSVNFRPSLNFHHDSEKFDFRFNYDGSTNQPDLSSLLSLTDNSNPLYITRGNPRLKAAYRQDFNVGVTHNPSGLSCEMSFSNIYNDQTMAVFYNPETGGRVTTPVNINGNRSGRLDLRYFKFNGKMLISGMINAGFDRSVGMVNEDLSEAPRKSVTNSDNYVINVSCNYMPKWGGVNVKGEWNFRHSSNDLRDDDDSVHSWSFGLSPYVQLPFGLNFDTDFNYRLRTGTNIVRKDNEEFLLNTRISYRFLKARVAEVGFEWKDILNNKKNYHRYSTYSGISESYTVALGSYFLVSFKYRFSKNL
ncbi:outer membrane beta-barrel protein [uncultured Duncaniella sp.]|uniref:outer membrane beta-barrel protein n=1 Tax=uncultured Duncaniella sp. TaxID=2768039 RepID=UPI00262FC043|nr:outer membrane beta-barrel protein [uncultured Duncaniella sp.]